VRHVALGLQEAGAQLWGCRQAEGGNVNRRGCLAFTAVDQGVGMASLAARDERCTR